MANNKTAEQIATEMVGLPWDQAKFLAHDSQCGFRFAKIDENHFMLTQDVDLNRVTVEVENGIVTKATVG